MTGSVHTRGRRNLLRGGQKIPWRGRGLRCRLSAVEIWQPGGPAEWPNSTDRAVGARRLSGSSYGYAYAPGAYYGGYAAPYSGYAYAPRRVYRRYYRY